MPARIADVLREIDADVVALQEVIGAGPLGAGQAEEIGAALGMGWVMSSVRHLRQHLFGNVVMSRFPIVHHSQYDLSWRTCEPRGCQRADLEVASGQFLHMYNVHLGTAVLERLRPAELRPGRPGHGPGWPVAVSETPGTCEVREGDGRGPARSREDGTRVRHESRADGRGTPRSRRDGKRSARSPGFRHGPARNRRPPPR